MKIKSLVLALFLSANILCAEGLKMQFNVEYDKSAKKYNLVINKKSKADEKTQKLIAQKSRRAFKLLFNKYNKYGRKLVNILNERRKLTKSSKSQEAIDSLSQSIRSVLVKTKDQSKSSVNRAYLQVYSLYEKMKQSFDEDIDGIEHKSANQQKKVKSRVLRQLKHSYKKQNKMIQRKLLSVKNTLYKTWKKIGERVASKCDKIKEEERKKGGRKLDDSTQMNKNAELKAFDNKINIYSKELESTSLLGRMGKFFDIQNLNTQKFTASFKKVPDHLDENDQSDPLALVGLTGDSRTLKLVSKLVKLSPPWLSLDESTHAIQTPKGRSLKYRKSVIRKTIQDIKSQHWHIIVKNGKKYAYIRRLNLYVPTNKMSKVDPNLIDSLIGKLQGNFNDLSHKKHRSSKTTLQKPNDALEKKVKIKHKRKLFAETAMAAGIGGAAGMASGLFKGFDAGQKMDRDIMNTEELLESQKIKEEHERDNFNKLFLAKTRFKRAVHYILALNKQITIRLDAKRDDLMQLLSEQEVY